MKKTLITLAALAAASVASAATLDLTSDTLPSSITFAGDSTDKIILDSVVTLSNTTVDGQTTSTLGGVTINGGPLFCTKADPAENRIVGVLNGATIDFGLSGRIDSDTNDLNAYMQKLTFTGKLDIVQINEDLKGTTAVVTRTLILDTAGTNKWGIWNMNADNSGVTSVSFTSTDSSSTSWAGFNVNDATLLSKGVGAYTLTRSATDNAGYGGNEVQLKYVVKYVPEPTTATLSLLALAGLAARRRRK